MLGLLLSAVPLAAQEIAVPIDSAGRLELIDRALERRLQFFTDIAGFVEARLFRAPDGSFTLEITHRMDGRLARTRRPLTAAEAHAFRNRVLALLATQAPNALLDQAGRGELLRSGFLVALGYYGWAVPYSLDVDSDRASAGAYMLTAGASFFLPLALTAHQPVTQGQASLASWGATRGIFIGLMTAEVTRGRDGSFTSNYDRKRVGVGLLTSVAGGVSGYVAGRNQSQGSADATGMMGDLFGGGGLGLAYVFGGFDQHPVEASCGPGCSVSVIGRRTIGYAGGIAGVAAGLFAGRKLASIEHTTRGDVGVFRAAALTGAWTGLAIGWTATNDREITKADVSWSLAGGTAGLVLGHLLTRNHDFTTGQGAMVTLGALGGGALGLGLGYLVTSPTSSSTPLLPSALGAGLGFGLVYAAFAREAREATEIGDRLEMHFNPVALLSRSADMPVPLVVGTFRF